MAQGAAQGAAKPAATKATLPLKGAPTANGASAPGVAKTGPRPVIANAPSAPKAQPRPVAPAAPVTKSVAGAPPLPGGRRSASTLADAADGAEVTLVEAMPAAIPKLGVAGPASAGTLLAAQPASKAGAAAASPSPREEVAPLVRSMVEQAMVPLDRAMRSMVEQATAPLERTMRSMVEQAMAPLDRTVRAAVEQAIAPLDGAMRDLQRRLEDVERRPAPAPVIVAAAMPRAAPIGQPQPGYPQARAIDVAAIERSVALGPEMQAFDGRRRRTRLVVTVVLACLVVFAGLFAALAQSYSHTHG